MHAETSRAGAAREARLRSTTADSPLSSSSSASALMAATTAAAAAAAASAATPASSSSSAAQSPRTPRRGKARSITYGDRFIPSRDGSDMQAAYQLMTDDLNAPSRSKRKLTADMDAQKEEANQAFSSLLTTELFGLPTPPKVNHNRTHSASASASANASASASPLPSGSASRPNSNSTSQHHSSADHRRSTSVAGIPPANGNGTGPAGRNAAAWTTWMAEAATRAAADGGAAGMYAHGTAAVQHPQHHATPRSAAAMGVGIVAGVGYASPSTGAGSGATAGTATATGTGTAGNGSGSRAGTPQQGQSGNGPESSSGSSASSTSSATGGAQPTNSEQAGQQPPTSDAVPSVAAPAAVPGPTVAAPAAGSGMGPSSGMMISSSGSLMHATNFSGAPTPTTPTKRNLLSYRSPSVGRSAGRTMAASGSSSSTGTGTANGIVSTAASSSSSPAPGDGAGSSGGMRGVRSSHSSTPGTPRTPGRAAAVSTGADDDVEMTMLRSGGSSSSLGAGTVSNENLGLARPGSGAGGRPAGLFGGVSSIRGGNGSNGGGGGNDGTGGGNGVNNAGLGMMDVMIDSPTHKAYSLSPVKLESQRMLLSPRRTPRTMSKVPYKVLDAPDLADDFYLNLVDWSPSNVLGVGLGHCVYLWSAKTAQVSKLVDLSGSKDRVTGLSWAGRGPHIAVGTDAGLVQIYDAEKMKLIRTHRGHTGRVGALAWNEHILSSGSRDRLIFHHDVRVREQYVAALAGHRQEVCGLKWSPESNQLASGGNDNKLMIWDGLHTTPLHRFTRHEAAIKALAWSPHQHGLLASGGGTADMKIRFWNTLTGQMLQEVDTGSQVCNLMWSKTANEVVSTHGYSAGKVQNQIQVWRYPTMQPLATLTGHTMRVLYLAMSPDGETIVTGAGDETLRFWDLNTPSKSQLEKRNESAAFNAFAKIR
ncbi:hypothetical protein A4X13_0g4492 [Tilletia indica]|uniref:CDC20/Fizzy WD40 domain-containing protein n=1 Tax=Tilletia indica TaxID=43049 RepID=A0A177T769_9BASI|nr:hypothetical protein A4X13_0g4492 [Tilletia indica]